MIRTYCDLCGKEIEDSNHQVNFDINAYGCAGFFPKEYNYHVECARVVERAIKQLGVDIEPYRKESESNE